MLWRNSILRINVFLDLRKKLKHKLRFWRADLPIAVVLLSLLAFAGLLGGLLYGLVGVVGAVIVMAAAIQYLDMIP